MTEGAIKRQVCDYLAMLRGRHGRGISFWMNETVAVRRRKRSSPYQKNGTSDLFIVMWGHFRALEMKKPGGTASQDQKDFIAELEVAGAKGAVAYTFEEAVFHIETWIRELGH